MLICSVLVFVDEWSTVPMFPINEYYIIVLIKEAYIFLHTALWRVLLIHPYMFTLCD